MCWLIGVSGGAGPWDSRVHGHVVLVAAVAVTQCGAAAPQVAAAWSGGTAVPVACEAVRWAAPQQQSSLRRLRLCLQQSRLAWRATEHAMRPRGQLATPVSTTSRLKTTMAQRRNMTGSVCSTGRRYFKAACKRTTSDMATTNLRARCCTP